VNLLSLEPLSSPAEAGSEAAGGLPPFTIEDLNRLCSSQADVILPFPFCRRRPGNQMQFPFCPLCSTYCGNGTVGTVTFCRSGTRNRNLIADPSETGTLFIKYLNICLTLNPVTDEEVDQLGEAAWVLRKVLGEVLGFQALQEDQANTLVENIPSTQENKPTKKKKGKKKRAAEGEKSETETMEEQNSSPGNSLPVSAGKPA